MGIQTGLLLAGFFFFDRLDKVGFFGFYFYGWLNGDCVVSIDFFFFYI